MKTTQDVYAIVGDSKKESASRSQVNSSLETLFSEYGLKKAKRRSSSSFSAGAGIVLLPPYESKDASVAMSYHTAVIGSESTGYFPLDAVQFAVSTSDNLVDREHEELREGIGIIFRQNSYQRIALD
ncbi:hypothetical protein AUJ84_00415 [Candidatus Pacearchaeota archaeon CG1_02_32_132]|nr:MAG: hypothetical protein AUJ84_00415 [Candidatus Pacearchaeota archaeon CG1_02_32_132]